MNFGTEETHSNSNSSSEEELEETPIKGAQKMSEYEKQRMKRIEENRARMEAMGLAKMASSLMGSSQRTKVKKKMKSVPRGNAKMAEEDEEYRPDEGEGGLSSSSEEDDDDDDDDDEEFVGAHGSRMSKVKKKYSTPKKKVSVQKLMSNSDFVDEDKDLLQAIALSLKDSAECSNVGHSGHSQSCDAHLTGNMVNERKGNAHIQEDTGKRKRKKSVTSRVQMTGDELIVHFFQFDEAGKGTINLRDLRRVATAHDFTWTDKEMIDMIYCFDSDGDGKLSLDDFQKIVGRCNMIQGSESS